jgi:hypothetical protein
MGIYPNAYYNYRKQTKAAYYAKKNEICRKIKGIYHEFGGILGYRCKQSSKVHTFSPANAHFFTAGF